MKERDGVTGDAAKLETAPPHALNHRDKRDDTRVLSLLSLTAQPVVADRVLDQILGLVGVTKTEPLRELVWESRKDPDHERQKIHDGAEDPHIARG